MHDHGRQKRPQKSKSGRNGETPEVARRHFRGANGAGASSSNGEARRRVSKLKAEKDPHTNCVVEELRSSSYRLWIGLVYECKSCSFLVHPLCVSSNSGLDQVRSALPSSGSTTQRIGEQVALGLATNYIYDTIKKDEDEQPTADSNALGNDEESGSFLGNEEESGTFLGNDEGSGSSFFDGIVNVIEFIFSISSK
ncbi:hypothetical protein Tco_1394512 [Tanacetum coccineum]